MTNKEAVYSALKAKNLSLAMICGIMANIQKESNYNPVAVGDSGTSYGLCQWHKGRWDSLKDYCKQRGIDANHITCQIDFMIWEMKKRYVSMWNLMVTYADNAVGANLAAYQMCVKYEVPANKQAKGEERGRIAEKLYTEYSGQVIETGVHYQIQTGDTLTRIAYRYSTTVDKILELNPSITDPDRIKAGDIISLPEHIEEKNDITRIMDGLMDIKGIVEDMLEWLHT